LPAAGPGAERSSADESADTNSRGDGWDIGAVCWLVADATLDALGGALSRLDRTHWKESVKSNVRRVYCEIAEKRSGNPGPDDDLFVELAQHSGTGKGGRDGAWLRDRIRRSGSGELHLFAPLGASLYLKYQSSADNRSWRSANCHRRDVGYSVLFHNLLCAQLDFLSTELSTESADEPGRETRDLRVGKIVEVAHRRMRLLADFHEKYWWLIYYSKQRKLLEKLELILSHVGSVFDDATIEAVRRSLEPTDR
jgi:hypothetical protein